MYNYEITVVFKFNNEEEARLVYYATSPDMNIRDKDMETNLYCKGNMIYLIIRSNSLSRLRGMVNSFFRTFRVISDII
jgi:tRNA threonylcarbamoyladenosine modification (KEOPS) complex  Pcc1 subunit